MDTSQLIRHFLETESRREAQREAYDQTYVMVEAIDTVDSVVLTFVSPDNMDEFIQGEVD